MKNATMVFKSPGPHKQDGLSYEYQIVEAEDVEAACADGWSKSVTEAAEAAKQSALDLDPPASDAAPTREELEQKATELGIKFDGRTSDKKLAAAVAEALKA